GNPPSPSCANSLNWTWSASISFANSLGASRAPPQPEFQTSISRDENGLQTLVPLFFLEGHGFRPCRSRAQSMAAFAAEACLQVRERESLYRLPYACSTRILYITRTSPGVR